MNKSELIERMADQAGISKTAAGAALDAATEAIKATLVASASGMPPSLAVEFGRKVLFAGDRPTFIELEEELKARKGR